MVVNDQRETPGLVQHDATFPQQKPPPAQGTGHGIVAQPQFRDPAHGGGVQPVDHGRIRRSPAIGEPGIASTPYRLSVTWFCR